MDDDNLKLREQIEQSKAHVTELFLRQCTYGEQTKKLQNPQLAGCGQFIGANAAGIKQSGLHGMAAALRVLGDCDREECRAIVRRLVSYCEASFNIGTTSPLPNEFDVKAEDKENTIKLAELLYGLSFVTTAQADSGTLIEAIAKRLNQSIIGDQGWGYFIGDKNPELLPTAYAIRGLARNGYDTTNPRKFLLDTLSRRAQSSTASHADLTTVIACAYCLTFAPNVEAVQKPILREAFLSVWPFTEPLLEEDIEQNVEYWRGDDTYYVRIPFQLYLLALASEYSQWRFAGFRAQHRLKCILVALRSNSFKYPYSGIYLSSRTNSIAFDALTDIRERIRNLTWLSIWSGIDSFRVFAGRLVVRRIGASLAACLIVYACWKWLIAGWDLSELAPELLASFLAVMLASGRR